MDAAKSICKLLNKLPFYIAQRPNLIIFKAANHELEMNSGMVFAVPIPNESAADTKSMQNAIDTAISEAR